MPRGYPGVDFRSQGVIFRRFKRKKKFVTNKRTNRWTDSRDGRNSDLDGANIFANGHYVSHKLKAKKPVRKIFCLFLLFSSSFSTKAE